MGGIGGNVLVLSSWRVLVTWKPLMRRKWLIQNKTVFFELCTVLYAV